MVKEIRRETVKYACKICGDEFDTKERAEKCEAQPSEKWSDGDYNVNDLLVIWKQDEYLPERVSYTNGFHIAKVIGWKQYKYGHILHPIIKILDTDEQEEVIVPYISEKKMDDRYCYSISIEFSVDKVYMNKILKWAELIREGKM